MILPRLNIKIDTVRSLFAKSGNQCAFPDCKSELIDEENDFISQVCHIAAASEGGERFDPLMSDEERRAFDNLMILCYPHHVKTNDVQRFSTDMLIEMKRQHEELCSKTPYDAPEESIQLIMKDQLDFSEEISNVSHERVKQLEVNLGDFLAWGFVWLWVGLLHLEFRCLILPLGASRLDVCWGLCICG